MGKVKVTYPDFGVKKGTFLGEDTPGWCGNAQPLY